MKKKIISLLLALCLIQMFMALSVTATENFTYAISATTTNPTIGKEFEVTIALTNYAKITSEIRALQIDIKNIDTDILEVVSHNSMLTDTSATSNKTSYSSTGKYVRYVYLNLSGTLDKTVTDVMKLKLKIKDTLTEDGAIVLPVSLKIGTKSENITLTDSLTINYQTISSDIINVNVSWGSMEFVYDSGIWDTEIHKWGNGGWRPTSENTNAITVTNTGSSNVKTLLSYTPVTGYEGISGVFTDSTNSIVSTAVEIAKGGTAYTYYLNLTGTTEDRWTDSYVKVGTVTLTLSE